jgi:hypothetical protein
VVSFLRAFRPKRCTFFSPLPACHIPCPPHSPWFDLPNDFGGEYKLWSSSLCYLLSLDSHILLRSSFSSSRNLCSSCRMRDQVLRPHWRTGKVIMICMCCSWYEPGKYIFWTECYQAFRYLHLLLTPFWMWLWSVSVIPKCLNFAAFSKDVLLPVSIVSVHETQFQYMSVWC